MRARRITGLAAVGFLTLAAVVVAQPPADPTAPSDLRTRQQQNADRFRSLQKKLLALAQRLDASDNPAEKQRAKVILAALDLAARENIDGQFKTLVGEMAKGGENVQELQRMVAQDAQLSKAIQDMLAVLMTDDEQARLKAEIARLEEALKEARAIRRTQESIRALTDAQKGDTADIAKSQRDLAERTKDLADRMTGPKKGAKNATDPKDGKDGKAGDPTDPKSKDGKDGKGGDPTDPKSKDGAKGGEKGKDAGKSGEKSKNGKNSEGKDKVGDPSGKKSDPKGSEGGKSGEKKDGKDGGKQSGDPKAGEKSKGGEPKEGSDGKGKEGQKGGKKSSDSSPKGKKDGQQSPMGDQQQSDPQQAPQPRQPGQPQQDQLPGRKYIQEAYPHQKAAEKDLDKKDRPSAGKNADQAIDELNKAIQELEKRLKQLREQEAVKLLAGLEARCARMLEMQRRVYAATQEIDAAVRKSGQKSTADIQKAQQQSDEERKIVTEADTALKLIQSEGSAVAFGRVLEEVREDMIAVERRLGSATVDADTQQIEANIIAMLDEMTKALAKQKKDMQQQQQQQQQQNQNNGPPPNRELVNLLAELKLIRTLQTQVNDRTKMYGAKSPGEQAADPQVQAELRTLAARQAKIEEMLNAIATGANK